VKHVGEIGSTGRITETMKTRKSDRKERAGSKIVRRSITLDAALDRAVRRVAGHGDFSAFVAESLVRRIQQDSILALLDELDAEYGPVGKAAERRAERTWQRLHGSRSTAAR